MSKKVKPSKRLSKRIQQLTSGRAEADDLLAELVDLGAQKILQEGLEAEVDEFWGAVGISTAAPRIPKATATGTARKLLKRKAGRYRCKFRGFARPKNPLSRGYWNGWTRSSNA